MSPILIIFVVLLLIVLYFVKINNDILKNKNAVLPALASLDALIIKKNLAVLELFGFAELVMEKESATIKELKKIYHEIKAISPKVKNAQQRHERQREFDRKIETFLGATQRYSDLTKNVNFQQCLQNYNKLNEEFKAKVDEYNHVIDALNVLMNSFPSSILASMANLKDTPPKYW